MSSSKTCSYSVSGTHCHSCEILIEKEVRKLSGVKSVLASTKDGTVTITYQGKAPQTHKLNQLFLDSGYLFSSKTNQPSSSSNSLNSFFLVGFILILFLILNYSGLTSLVTVTQTSFFGSFFLFGLLAGFSTCAALVGGLLLSVSQTWTQGSSSLTEKLKPFLFFNLARLFSFALFGYLLGLLGQFFHLSLSFSAIITILVSLLMIALALQMLGFKAFSNFQISLPKSLSSKIVDESTFSRRLLPFATGFFSFFLPCGFTLTAQSLALTSGSPLKGSLILFSFALGTFLPLFLISLTSAKYSSSNKYSGLFATVAGTLVLIFSLFNINSQLSVLNLPNLSLNQLKASQSQEEISLPPLVNGKQVVNMAVTNSGYSPAVIRVKQGVPVLWQIDGTKASGCTNAIVSKELFPDTISLSALDTTNFEFTPQKKGTYRFSCWMGMVNGTIEVI